MRRAKKASVGNLGDILGLSTQGTNYHVGRLIRATYERQMMSKAYTKERLQQQLQKQIDDRDKIDKQAEELVQLDTELTRALDADEAMQKLLLEDEQATQIPQSKSARRKARKKKAATMP